MARNKNNTTPAADESPIQVEASSLEGNEETGKEDSGDMISIAVSLPFGMIFDDIPNGRGGKKKIALPGMNDHLKGLRSGVLALPGNALCVRLPKADWEALKRLHGKEIAFTGRNGSVPCIFEVGDKAGFKAAQSEIAEITHGLEALDPKDAGVEEAKQRG